MSLYSDMYGGGSAGARWWTGVLRADSSRVLVDGGLALAIQLIVDRQRANLTPDREAYRNIDVPLSRAEVIALRDACDRALMPDTNDPLAIRGEADADPEPTLGPEPQPYSDAEWLDPLAERGGIP